MNKKVTKIFSGSLMRQNLRSNLALMVVVILIMCMMSIVITFAGTMLGGDSDQKDYTKDEEDFYSYLYVLASYNESEGTNLSYDDFEKADDKSTYKTAFEQMDQLSDQDFSVKGFEDTIDKLSKSDVSMKTYVSEFEYVFALDNVKGCFSGDKLDVDSLLKDMLETMGLSSDMIKDMSNMDTSSMLTRMYYTVMIILPALLLIIFVGNALIVDQVDKGSMAYILSTPTKRSAVAITQAIYMIVVPFVIVGIVCCVRMAAIQAFTGDLNVQQTLALYGGLYLLIEAMASICYFASCFFNLSKNAMALGGGLNIWFFLASLLGMFGTKNMVDMGIGVKALDRFNHMTLIGLFDIDALSTVGSSHVNTDFVWKLCVLVGIAVVFYVAGAIRFQRKDLPL